jgi:hypothetical protein
MILNARISKLKYVIQGGCSVNASIKLKFK